MGSNILQAIKKYCICCGKRQNSRKHETTAPPNAPNAKRYDLCNTEVSNSNPLKGHTTERFTDLGKLNFLMVVGFRLEPIFNIAPAASKNNAQFKSGQN